MKGSLTAHWLRAVMLSALFLSAGAVLSVQGCLPPPRRVIVPPPPLVLPAPPFLYLIPGTYAYFVADSDADLFFYQGYWYRPYGSRWYYAPDYSGPWTVIITHRVPLVIRNLPPTYRLVSSPSGRLHYNDVRNNWRAWERDRHWDRHEEQKRERYEQEDRGRDRDSRTGRGRWQEPREQRELPRRGRDTYKDRDERTGRVRNEGQGGGNGRGQDMRPGQAFPSGPARRVTQPRDEQQEKKESVPSKKRQERKKDQSRQNAGHQDRGSSDDGNERDRDEDSQGRGRDR